MVRVFFENKTGKYAEQAATFEDEDVFVACLPALKKEANDQGMIVTESVEDNYIDGNEIDEDISLRLKMLKEHLSDILSQKKNPETTGRLKLLIIHEEKLTAQINLLTSIRNNYLNKLL